MSTKNKKIPKSTRLEDALGDLETVVRELESGELPLDQSLERFERGIALTRFCQQSLKAAEHTVMQLQANGLDEQLVPFEDESTDSPQSLLDDADDEDEDF